jgi:hypothetical protein
LLFARANIYSRSKQEERAPTVGGNPHPILLSDKELTSKLLVSDLVSMFFFFSFVKEKIKVTRKWQPVSVVYLYLKWLKRKPPRT